MAAAAAAAVVTLLAVAMQQEEEEEQKEEKEDDGELNEAGVLRPVRNSVTTSAAAAAAIGVCLLRPPTRSRCGRSSSQLEESLRRRSLRALPPGRPPPLPPRLQ
jgi:hypothetical protein